MSATARARTVAGGGVVTHEGIFLVEQLWSIKRQLVLALIGLAIGGLRGLMQALDRVGIVVYTAMLMQTYYRGLTIHGVLLALLFTFAFSNAFVSLVAIRGFERPLASTFLAQGAFWTMLVGTLLAAYAILTNQATVLFTFYAPLRAGSFSSSAQRCWSSRHCSLRSISCSRAAPGSASIPGNAPRCSVSWVW